MAAHPDMGLFQPAGEPVPLFAFAEANTGGDTQPAGFHWKAGAAFRLQQFVVVVAASLAAARFRCRADWRKV